MSRKAINDIKREIRERTADMNEPEYIELLMELSTWAHDEALKMEYELEEMEEEDA